MNYKETLFFIGKSLTINHEEHNKIIVENELKSNKIDWDAVVKVSTAHFVFPALYCNYKKANFLHYLPSDLVEYMKHITDLNRERNQQIIDQAKEINELLLANNITPIFLKGTGNLLEGLYEDNAERMVGDIDFLLSNNECLTAFNILKKKGYKYLPETKGTPKFHRHYNRIIKEGKIGAIEIHKDMLVKKYASNFNYQLIKKNVIKRNNFCLLNFDDQIILTILSKQINDYGYYLKTISLRNSYDVFLLSRKTNSLKSVNKLKILHKQLNSYLAVSSLVFNNPKSVQFEKNTNSKSYLKTSLKTIENPNYQKLHSFFWNNYFFITKGLSIFIKAIYKKPYRDYVKERFFK